MPSSNASDSMFAWASASAGVSRPASDGTTLTMNALIAASARRPAAEPSTRMIWSVTSSPK